MLNFENLALFPLYPIRNGRCACGDPSCKQIGKHPAMQWSRIGIAEKYAKIEDGGVGLATGTRSGVFVVDLDIREGLNGYAELMKMGPIPPTLTVHTPSGGAHLYFQLPWFRVKNSAGKLGPGIDIRGEGGFVVAPDSPGANGSSYRVVIDLPPACAPDWLLQWPGLVKGSFERSDASDIAPTPVQGEELAGNEFRGRNLAKAWNPSIQGQGGSNQLLGLCLKLVRTLELPLDLCVQIIEEEYNHRCEPPWSLKEIWHKVTDARDKIDRPTGSELKPVQEWKKEIETLPVLRGVEAKTPTLRVHDPKHEYTFEPGRTASATEIKKLPMNEVAFLLTNLPEWSGVLQYDEFRKRIWAVDPPMRLDAEGLSGLSDRDVTIIRMYLQTQGVSITKDDLWGALEAAASNCSFHPVRGYLDSCKGREQVGIFDTAAEKIFGSEDEFSCDFLKRFMIGAVRRVYEPGCQMDTMLVLWGAEGGGKTSFVQTLFGEEYTRSQMPSLESRDASAALLGHWAVEFAEMDAVLRSKSETFKEWCTRRVDTYRAPYGRAEVRMPRECVLIGTTNDPEFIHHSGTNRRYWPVPVKSVNLPWVQENRDALWGEAIRLYLSGERHWYEGNEETRILRSRESFQVEDPWADLLRSYVQGKAGFVVSTEEVFREAICRGLSDNLKFGTGVQRRITQILRDLACECVRVGNNRRWRLPNNS